MKRTRPGLGRLSRLGPARAIEVDRSLVEGVAIAHGLDRNHPRASTGNPSTDLDRQLGRLGPRPWRGKPEAGNARVRLGEILYGVDDQRDVLTVADERAARRLSRGPGCRRARDTTHRLRVADRRLAAR